MSRWPLPVLTALALAVLSVRAEGELPTPKPGPEVKLPRPKRSRARTFNFTYEATVTGLKAGQLARVWVPVPPVATDVQLVSIQGVELPPGARTTSEPQYGNRMNYVEAKANGAGKIPLKMRYRVTRREVQGATGTRIKDVAPLARFLRPDALVPIDGKPLDLIKGKELPADAEGKARVFYDVVNAHLRYSKEGKGWGRGDSVWACDSKCGNCSDFHSLFISLARSQKVPAKFEMGFGLPKERGAGAIGGYHCWAFFKPAGKGWVPVDISEANKDPKMHDYYFGNLTEDRVAFSTGRDIDLVPKQAGKPLNFFIYPHVEVDGKEHPQEKVVCKFSFRDVKDGPR
jgi:transglutaminase-like putative cysteine protease